MSRQLYRFALTPKGGLPEPLSVRMKYAIDRALACGLRITDVSLAVEREGNGGNSTEARLRNWLKSVGRRGGLKARWPDPDAFAEVPANQGIAQYNAPEKDGHPPDASGVDRSLPAGRRRRRRGRAGEPGSVSPAPAEAVDAQAFCGTPPTKRPGDAVQHQAPKKGAIYPLGELAPESGADPSASARIPQPHAHAREAGNLSGTVVSDTLSLESTAYHEGGHAVAALSLKLDIDSVSIIPDASPPRPTLGRCTTRGADDLPPDDFAAYMMAGVAAVALAGHDSPAAGSGSDLKRLGGDLDHVDRGIRGAMKLLTGRWADVELVARLLLERRTLTGADVVAAVTPRRKVLFYLLPPTPGPTGKGSIR